MTTIVDMHSEEEKKTDLAKYKLQKNYLQKINKIK